MKALGAPLVGRGRSEGSTAIFDAPYASTPATPIPKRTLTIPGDRPLPPTFAPAGAPALPIWFVDASNWETLRTKLGAAAKFAEACGFEPKAGKLQLLPGDDGAPAGVLFGQGPIGERGRDPLGAGKLATALPPGIYAFGNAPHELELSALAFLLGSYRFDKYRPAGAARAQLAAPTGVDAARLERMAAAMCRGRDLINTPANDLGPEALEAHAVELARSHGASVNVLRGAALPAANFPLIHAVGRAAAEEPRLVDFRRGRSGAPKVTLVGKGVTFDTGGLDIKPASGMELMKKDMGGAATALALAEMILGEGLDVDLRVLLPIVENSISAGAFRPGDVLTSRKGQHVEIGNTDAEGRLILADALAYADEDAPDLMFDFATLTGAARVALGPDLPPFYCDDEKLAAEIGRHAVAAADPVWRMPLWPGYESMIAGSVGDLTNSPGSAFAGSITAALFLRRFVEKARIWAHFDVYAWNPKPRAHGPEGGEIQAARGLFALLRERFGG